MKTLLTSSLILLLTACAGPLYTLPAGLADIAPETPIACRFEKQWADEKNQQKANWYFWRQAQRTETRDDVSKQGEIWEKNAAGQLFYSRLFFNEKVALEFTPGDLAATGATASWRQLSSIVDPNTLGEALALTKKDHSGKMPIDYYSGSINGVATEVDWLPSLKLPVRLMKKLPEGTVTLIMSECGDASKLAVKPISKAELDDFRHLDYTDLGDMEEDPMVRHLEELMGGHHHAH